MTRTPLLRHVPLATSTCWSTTPASRGPEAFSPTQRFRPREQFEVNFVGSLRMARAFAPVLANNGGGAIINVLSVASWMNGPMLATYGASKSAAWALTNGLRIELAEQGTQVVGLHAGFIDTDAARDVDAPKTSPEEIVRVTLDALEHGEDQVLADEISRLVHRGLSADRPVYFQSAAQLRSHMGLPAA
jgi:NAD(P)-dependent dehydrogenase (short-subunit alcohol dehydrogenase family)